MLYESLLLPMFIEYEGDIDEQIIVHSGNIRRNLLQFMRNGGNELIQSTMNNFFLALKLSRQLLSTKQTSYDSIQSLTHKYCTNREVEMSQIEEEEEEEEGTWYINPQHSLSEINYSSPSYENITSIFVPNFIRMLSKGLYVFSKIKLKPQLFEVEKDQSQSRFQLKIFAIHTNASCFIVADVDSTKDIRRNPLRIKFRDINRFCRSGMQEIRFEFVTEKSNTSTAVYCEIALADIDDCKILLEGLNKCLPYLKNRQNL